MDAARQAPAPNSSDPIQVIDAALTELLRMRRPRGPFGGPPFGAHVGGPHGRGPHARGPRGFAMGRLLEQLELADDRGEQVGVGELADAIGVDQPRASRLVADAVSRGYAIRETDARDARRSAIRITTEGRTHLEHTRARRRASVEAALADFSDQDAATLADLLARLAHGWPRD